MLKVFQVHFGPFNTKSINIKRCGGRWGGELKKCTCIYEWKLVVDTIQVILVMLKYSCILKWTF